MSTIDEKLNDFMLKTSNQITQLQVELKGLSELIKTSIINHASKGDTERLDKKIEEQSKEIEEIRNQISGLWKSIAFGAVGIITTIVLTALKLI